LTRQVSIARKAESGGAGPIAAAMSQTLGELSDRIAAAVATVPLRAARR
jgi:hypothetical protein